MTISRFFHSSFPLFTTGAMIYGAAHAYNNFQDKTSSPITYIEFAVSISAIQNIWTILLPAAASPNAAGIGIGLATLVAASLYNCGVMYAAMLAGQQIGMAARPQHTIVSQNRELR